MRSRFDKVWDDFEIDGQSAQLGIRGNANKTTFTIKMKGAKKPLIQIKFYTNTLARILLEASRILRGTLRDTREIYK